MRGRSRRWRSAIQNSFAEVGAELAGAEWLRHFSLTESLDTVGRWLLAKPDADVPDGLAGSFLGVAGTTALSLLVVAWRLRKMELES